jgi:hypothetical protein
VLHDSMTCGDALLTVALCPNVQVPRMLSILHRQGGAKASTSETLELAGVRGPPKCARVRLYAPWRTGALDSFTVRTAIIVPPPAMTPLPSGSE